MPITKQLMIDFRMPHTTHLLFLLNYLKLHLVKPLKFTIFALQFTNTITEGRVPSLKRK